MGLRTSLGIAARDSPWRPGSPGPPQVDGPILEAVAEAVAAAAHPVQRRVGLAQGGLVVLVAAEEVIALHALAGIVEHGQPMADIAGALEGVGGLRKGGLQQVDPTSPQDAVDDT